MGACSSTTETNWDFLYSNNFQYSQRIFEWCAQNQKNLIYASSAATYGAGEYGFDDSTDSEKLKPLNLYGESKVIMDRWALKQKATPQNWYGLKFFNVFGPNEYEKGSMASVAFKAFNQIESTSELGLFRSYNPQYKNGMQLRDFVYIKDVVRWMQELMEKKPASGIYNLGFGKAAHVTDRTGLVEPGTHNVGDGIGNQSPVLNSKRVRLTQRLAHRRVTCAGAFVGPHKNIAQ